MLNKLNADLGPRGLQPVAVAFGPNATESVLAHLVDYFKITYPVGLSAHPSRWTPIWDVREKKF
jgi:hypothetical protein